jgi:GAF domain-containing protein
MPGGQLRLSHAQLLGDEQMQHPGFRLPDLPQDKITADQPSSFYAENKSLVWGVVIGVVSLTAMLLAFFTNMLGRRRAERELGEKNRELKAIRDSMEQYVDARTADLERRSEQFKAAAHVTRNAAAIRDVGQLLSETVRLISDRFEFYHAGIFLLDETREYAVLRAASSEGGQQMLARGRQLRVGEEGLVGIVASTAQPRIALDISEDVTFPDRLDLPRTRSEMAVPMTVRGRVTGVLDVQSTQPAAFSNEDIAVLQVLADQVALGVENAYQLEEIQNQLEESRALAGQYEREGWQALALKQAGQGYVYDGVDVLPSDATSTPDAAPQLTVPLQVRSETIGNLNLVLGDRAPTLEEADLAQAITEQASQALERAQLFQETQRRVARERVIREVSDKMQRATDVDAVLRTAVREIRESLGLHSVMIQLEMADEPGLTKE